VRGWTQYHPARCRRRLSSVHLKVCPITTSPPVPHTFSVPTPLRSPLPDHLHTHTCARTGQWFGSGGASVSIEHAPKDANVRTTCSCCSPPPAKNHMLGLTLLVIRTVPKKFLIRLTFLFTPQKKKLLITSRHMAGFGWWGNTSRSSSRPKTKTCRGRLRSAPPNARGHVLEQACCTIYHWPVTPLLFFFSPFLLFIGATHLPAFFLTLAPSLLKKRK
jgi:hypothetical protein